MRSVQLPHRLNVPELTQTVLYLGNFFAVKRKINFGSWLRECHLISCCDHRNVLHTVQRKESRDQTCTNFVSLQLQRARRCKSKALISSKECNDVELIRDSNYTQCECNACIDPKKFRPQLAACSSPHSCAPVPQDWDYMVSGIPNRTKTDEPRIVTEV